MSLYILYYGPQGRLKTSCIYILSFYNNLFTCTIYTLYICIYNVYNANYIYTVYYCMRPSSAVRCVVFRENTINE